MGFEQFEKDLAEKGEPIEYEFLEILKERFDTEAYKVKGYCKEWDLVCPNTNKTYEVKNNSEAFKCVCIETSCVGNPSGIVTTKADFWVFLALDTFFVIKTEKLKKLIVGKEVKEFILYGREIEMVNLDIAVLRFNCDKIFERVKE